MPLSCPCEDDDGVVCGAPMTTEEFEQDGMCWSCADRMWEYCRKIQQGFHNALFLHPKKD